MLGLADVPTGTLGINFLQRYELLVDSCRLQLADPSSDNKLRGFKFRTDARQINGTCDDISNGFQLIFIKFLLLTKPFEKVDSLTYRLAHHIATVGPLVTD